MIRTLALHLLMGLALGAGASAHAQQGALFDIWEYRIGGNTVLTSRQIETAIYEFLGPAQSIDDVERARTVLEQQYRDAGYSTALVTIPEQSVVDGIVRLEVTEGTLGQVRVTNARYVSGRDIRAEIDSLKTGEPISFPEFQEDLSDVNRLSADRSVTPILKAGRRPSEVDVELRVNDALPFHGGFELSDRYTADTSELRSTGTISYDNLFQKFHSLSLQYTTSPQEPANTRVAAATYLWRFKTTPTVLAFYGVDTDSDVATVGDLNVLGSGRIYGLRVVHPLSANEGGFFHTATLGLDYKDVTETIGEALQTPISYTNLSLDYAFGWNSEHYRASYDIGASFGLGAFGNSPVEFGNKRFKAQPNYFYVRAGTEQLRRIWGGVGLYARVEGQYTTQPLISNEQFSAGGASSVRGYLEAERLGDIGLFANIEVRSPDFGRQLWQELDSAYLFRFLRCRDVEFARDFARTGPEFRFSRNRGRAESDCRPIQSGRGLRASPA